MEERYKLILGDCIEKMKELPDASVDAIVCDPPYGLEFMGKEWDTFTGSDTGIIATPPSIYGEKGFKKLPIFRGYTTEQTNQFQDFNFKWATEALRVLKAGGFLFAMGGTRTHHRLTCGIEDAGFLIHDELCWVYLQGFPKAQDLAMLIEKKLGGEGEVVGKRESPSKENAVKVGDWGFESGMIDVKQPTIPEAQKWSGWKTPALKPAFEPIVVAQKPCEGSITENVMKLGVGGYNIDACRIPYENEGEDERLGGKGSWTTTEPQTIYGGGNGLPRGEVFSSEKGRYPSNLMMTEPCFDIESDAVVKANEKPATGHIPKVGGAVGLHEGGWKELQQTEAYFKNASFSKFFLIPKASKGEKEEDLDEFEEKQVRRLSGGDFETNSGSVNSDKAGGTSKNFHPTVKPVLLMEHLIKLTTTNYSVVLDPFMGSGTTGVACMNLNRKFIGMEIDEGYFKIAEKRISEASKQSKLF